MCTASWILAEGSLELFFNRDESVERGQAQPPSEALEGGVRYLAPTDADAGGTWVGANEHGLALGLLNAGDADGLRARELVSRGLLVRSLFAARDPADVERRLLEEDLERFRGFRLLALAVGAKPVSCAWDGTRLLNEVPRAPLASSSLGSSRAAAARAAVLDELAARDELTPTLLETFHASHLPERGSWSVCMHRADARTVSSCHVSITRERIRLRYAPGAPCEASFGSPLELRR